MSSEVRTSSRRASNTIAATPGPARGVARGPDVTGADPRRWLILAVVALAQLMVVLDATIVNIALPSAQHALRFSDIERQWVVTAYALAFGSLLLLGGRLTDIIGRKATFIAGLIGFAGASAAGGAAGSFGMLVAARACQGVFGALLAPAALSLLTTTFEGTKDRGKAFGVFGAIAGAGGAVGLLLGGLLTQYLDWRWCLYVNLVFAAIACAGAVVLLRQQPASGRPRLDLPGLAAEAGGMFGIVYGFSNAASDGWHAPATWGFLSAGAVLLTAFGYLETRVRQPLLPPRIVADRNRAASYLSILITGAGMFGIFLFLTYYLQETLGFSPVIARRRLPAHGRRDHRQRQPGQHRAAAPHRPQVARRAGHARCRRRAGLADPDRRPHQLPGGCPAATAARLHRPRLRDVTVDEHRDRPESRRRTRASHRPWSTPASRSAVRSARRCSILSRPAPPPATWPATSAPG